MISLKKGFPFRLGTSSFIIPAGILENVEMLSPNFDDIEILVFESDRISQLPSEEEILRLVEIAAAKDLTYTVHLPLDINLQQTKSLVVKEAEAVLRIIERLSPLSPFGWILHLPFPAPLPSPVSASEILDNARIFIGRLRDNLPFASSDLCIENLDYDFNFVSELIQVFDLSVCFDLGHALRLGLDPHLFWDQWKERVKIVHLHGLNAQGKDHCELTCLPFKTLSDLISVLSADHHRFRRVLTIEVFGIEKLNSSLETMQKIRKELAECQES